MKTLLDQQPTVSESTIAAPPNQLALSPAAPSVEAMLMHAIDKGIDPAGLEKLADLFERAQAKRAEHAYVDAMREFRQACPPLYKNREAVDRSGNNNKHLYDFLDLPGLQRIVDPLLAEHGFNYRWDGKVTPDGITTVCILSHIEGHREIAEFSCQASGTSIMSQPQKAASATTFGRRYSLLGVLGMSAENDDDGASATPPDVPQQRPGAPVAQARADRITQEELKSLIDLWKIVMQKAKRPVDLGALGTWVQKTVGIDPEYSRHITHWTRTQLEKAFVELESQNG